jgi:hypothetical protein
MVEIINKGRNHMVISKRLQTDVLGDSLVTWFETTKCLVISKSLLPSHLLTNRGS